MVSILQIDALGKRYGLLPSEVLVRANSFDLYILDCSLTFESFYHRKQLNKGKVDPKDYDIEALKRINEKASGVKNA
jgi:hypothetical protein